MYNYVFGNISLFHYFAGKINKIVLIHEKFVYAKENKTLEEKD